MSKIRKDTVDSYLAALQELEKIGKNGQIIKFSDVTSVFVEVGLPIFYRAVELHFFKRIGHGKYITNGEINREDARILAKYVSSKVIESKTSKKKHLAEEEYMASIKKEA